MLALLLKCNFLFLFQEVDISCNLWFNLFSVYHLIIVWLNKFYEIVIKSELFWQTSQLIVLALMTQIQSQSEFHVTQHTNISYLVLTGSVVPFSLDFFFHPCVNASFGSKKARTATASWEKTPASGWNPYSWSWTDLYHPGNCHSAP